MAFEDIKIRCYHEDFDRARVEDLERTCEVGPSERVFLFTDTMGDPICRIRNSPMYMMLVPLSYFLRLFSIDLCNTCFINILFKNITLIC